MPKWRKVSIFFFKIIYTILCILLLLGIPEETVVAEDTSQNDDFKSVRQKRKRKKGVEMEVSTEEGTKRPNFPPVDASSILVCQVLGGFALNKGSVRLSFLAFRSVRGKSPGPGGGEQGIIPLDLTF